jgi:hypothetical protein
MKNLKLQKCLKWQLEVTISFKTLCSHGEEFRFHGHGGYSTHSCGNFEENFILGIR